MKNFIGLCFWVIVGTLKAQIPYLSELSKFYDPSLTPFYHGVASGDPTPHSVMIWTKLTTELPTTEVNWQIATDSLFTQIVQKGTFQTSQDNNHTVLVDVEGLAPDTYYFYRFSHQNAFSIVGRTKTAPIGDNAKVVFAVVSCSNYEAGYFNAYAAIAQRNDLDAVLHLGDYIYEYQTNRYGNKKLPRKNIPATELIKLDDYRARYSLYRLDADLRRLHARHPFITIWDDHETANDTYSEGAQNHQPETEGPWQERKAAARQAYLEWLPVRLNNQKLYRSFAFGNLVDLFMLEERHEARSKQVANAKDPLYSDTSRQVLGHAQMQWLKQGLQNSRARWIVLGNQVILSSIDASRVLPNNPKGMDMWDGYPAARNRLFDLLETKNNIIVVSGDSHTSWAMELTRYPQNSDWYQPKTGKGVCGAEFATPSVTSANYDEYVARWKAKIANKRFLSDNLNPHVQFCNLTEHGFLLLTLDKNQAKGEWFYMKRIDKPDKNYYKAATLFFRDRKVLK